MTEENIDSKETMNTEPKWVFHTSYDRDMICQRTTDPTEKIMEQLISLQDQGVRDALIKLGWTPPKAREALPEPTSTRPLWQVMHDAFLAVDACEEGAEVELRRGFAAEIRAIAQWIRKRHALPTSTEIYIGANIVAAELLVEADSAEAGG